MHMLLCYRTNIIVIAYAFIIVISGYIAEAYISMYYYFSLKLDELSIYSNSRLPIILSTEPV